MDGHFKLIACSKRTRERIDQNFETNIQKNLGCMYIYNESIIQSIQKREMINQ